MPWFKAAFLDHLHEKPRLLDFCSAQWLIGYLQALSVTKVGVSSIDFASLSTLPLPLLVLLLLVNLLLPLTPPPPPPPLLSLSLSVTLEDQCSRERRSGWTSIISRSEFRPQLEPTIIKELHWICVLWSN